MVKAADVKDEVKKTKGKGDEDDEGSIITMDKEDIVIKDAKTGRKRSVLDMGWLFRKGSGLTKKAREEELDPKKLAEMKKADRMRYRRSKQDKEQLRGQKLYDITPVDEEVWEIVDPIYGIREPYSYTRMLRNKRTKELLYEVLEPPLDPEERYLHDYLRSTLEHNIEVDRGEVDDIENEMRLRYQMRKFLAQAGKTMEIPSFEKVFYYLSNYFLGYGKIQVMMEDLDMEDVSCDGTGIPLYVFHRKYKNTRTSIVFEEEEELDDFVVGLAQRSGKHISIMSPILDATLPDGSRLNATFGKEITTKGSSFTIRKFKEDPLTMVNMILFKTLSPEMAAHLWLAVQYGDTMMVSGGTASGKTTTLNAISHFIPPSSKIITIEDTREMQLPHLNWIAGLTRERKGEVTGQSIDMYTLLVAALRQRPEYMIVGEVRGKETMAVFQAMATGQVTYATIHADSVSAIVHRLENPPINIPRILILGLNLVLLQAQVRVKNKRTRRVKDLVEIVGQDPVSQEIISNKVYTWNQAKDEFRFSGHSNLYEKIMDREGLTTDEITDEIHNRADVLRWLAYRDMTNYQEVANIVNEYYRNPKPLVERARNELTALRLEKTDLKL
ncbi:MAG: type II/IV secretion system ATPase subunit [Candidatus Thermoplasmatota archaeon]|nr:type II/IV secretion system ATPase subunit [Candidatus Thermoplasmatota archaeon]